MAWVRITKDYPDYVPDPKVRRMLDLRAGMEISQPQHVVDDLVIRGYGVAITPPSDKKTTKAGKTVRRG